MRRLPRFVIAISVLLAGCTEGASLVQPGSSCGAKDVYEVYLDVRTSDVSAAIKALRARHPVQVVDVFIGTPGFAGRMGRMTALALGSEKSVDLVLPVRCGTITLE
jgi:hypothetical protein